VSVDRGIARPCPEHRSYLLCDGTFRARVLASDSLKSPGCRRMKRHAALAIFDALDMPACLCSQKKTVSVGRQMFGRGTGRSYPQANRCFPPSRGGLSQVMGTIALCWRSREPPPCATGDARDRLARAASRWTHRGQAARWDDHYRQGQ
jgi:hypothetical protein